MTLETLYEERDELLAREWKVLPLTTDKKKYLMTLLHARLPCSADTP